MVNNIDFNDSLETWCDLNNGLTEGEIEGIINSHKWDFSAALMDILSHNPSEKSNEKEIDELQSRFEVRPV